MRWRATLFEELSAVGGANFVFSDDFAPEDSAWVGPYEAGWCSV